MVRVGGSIGWAAIGSLIARSQIVSATVAVGQPGDRDDVARLDFIDRLALEAAEGQHLGDAALLDELAVARQRLDGLVRP